MFLPSCGQDKPPKQESTQQLEDQIVPKSTGHEIDELELEKMLSDSSFKAIDRIKTLDEFSHIMDSIPEAFQDSTFIASLFSEDTLLNGNNLLVKVFIHNNSIYDSEEIIPIVRFSKFIPQKSNELLQKNGSLAQVIEDTAYAKAWYFDSNLKKGEYTDKIFYCVMNIPLNNRDTTLILEREFVLEGH